MAQNIEHKRRNQSYLRQASNTDGYFAVSGHWIEEPTPGVWHVENALLGFKRLNNSHSGKRLGQALFKVVADLEISHKVL
jgi:hypothetical protein